MQSQHSCFQAGRGVIAASALIFMLTSPSAFSAQWGIGAGVASTQKPYKDISRDTTPLPLIYFDNDYLHFFATEAEIKLPGLVFSENQQLNFGLIARYDGSGYKSGDADILDGMAKRKGGFWGGAKVEWRHNWATLHADWTHDLSGNSKGQRVNLGVERSWQAGDFSLTPRVVATWHDKKYVDYYYGVRAEESRTWRPAYQGESTVGVAVGLRTGWQPALHHAFMLDLQATRLGSEIKDSPLVDSASENRVFLGYLYRF